MISDDASLVYTVYQWLKHGAIANARHVEPPNVSPPLNLAFLVLLVFDPAHADAAAIRQEDTAHILPTV